MYESLGNDSGHSQVTNTLTLQSIFVELWNLSTNKSIFMVGKPYEVLLSTLKALSKHSQSTNLENKIMMCITGTWHNKSGLFLYCNSVSRPCVCMVSYYAYNANNISPKIIYLTCTFSMFSKYLSLTLIYFPIFRYWAYRHTHRQPTVKNIFSDITTNYYK